MKITLTYIHHNCFVLECSQRAFLFDYPGPAHLVEGAEAAMTRAISGKSLFIFSSHSHADHFHPDMQELCSPAARTWFVLSDDILDMFPEAVPRGSLIVEPEESYEFMGLTIDTLMSNDLGVAFLIRLGDLIIYYGGDLANWNWDSDPVKQRRFTQNFFSAALRRISTHAVDVAFSNADKRLRSQCGAEEFVRTIRPKVFVPMHTFGHLDWLEGLIAPTEESGSKLFTYAKPGDTVEFEV
ncbi:MAG: MBL fold metallo-hydrolase [Proteobacteria bacterium]|nr:MBL fold metallo-hydrolase [Pseudomonadota bacterium]MBU1612077.1 MBL fold metallo-hydrolase [Pseudomonadota bacterium]